MSIIDEIKNAREQMLALGYKQQLLAYIKKNLTTKEYIVISGGSHFHSDWKIPNPESEDWWRECSAPYHYHPAITEWLESLGFACSRYYNGFGVDTGIRVSL